MPSFAQSELNTEVTAMVAGDFSAADFLTVSNRAVRDVNSEIDLRSLIRSSSLSPNLFDEVYQYTYPSDAKGNKIIDLAPQLNRGRLDIWDLVSQEEFDREKNGECGLLAISRDDLVNKLLVSIPIGSDETGISTLDSVGDWTAFGDGTNLTADADNYIKGSGSINWDINADGGTTAGIYNDSLDTFDVSKYITNGSVFVWAYISSVTNLTNFILRIGSSSSAYYYITVTTNNEGASFYTGWNLLRFDFINKSTTGTPDDDACDYVAIYMTKDAAKTSETDYRFNNLTMMLGDHYNLKYYSRYGWQSNAGVYLEDATATTDLINCETDEYNLYTLKTAQYMEQHLKNQANATIYKDEYEKAKEKYIFENPSQALVINQEYYTF